jgi:hypothetical protein
MVELLVEAQIVDCKKKVGVARKIYVLEWESDSDCQ